MLPLIIIACLAASAPTELERYLDDFLAPISKMRGFEKRRATAHSYIPMVEQYAKQYKIDPLLIAVTMSMESSWKVSAIGAAKEVGLMQVHGVARRGFDVSTPAGQLEAGTAHLRYSFDMCGQDLVKSINAYLSGRCKPVIGKAKRRARLYKRAVRRYRVNDR